MIDLLGIEKNIKAFIKGWSHSRCINYVKFNCCNGFIVSEFDTPIGSIPRRYEFFVWNYEHFNDWNFKTLSNNEFHFVSLFNPNKITCEYMKSNGYKNIIDESFMFLDLKKFRCNQIDEKVELIQNEEQAHWYNEQRGSEVISTLKLNDKNIMFFSFKVSNDLASWARLIINNDYAIIDDVQTKLLHRRQGFAKNIMNTLIHYAYERKVTGIVLSASNEGKSLYEFYGFKTISEMKIFAIQNFACEMR